MDAALFENFLLAMIAIVNPLGKVPIWVEAAEGCDDATRRRLAALITATAFGLLVLFLFFGEAILSFLGIDLPAFRVGGGIIILLLGIDMLRGQAVDLGDPDDAEGGDAFDRAKSRYREIVIPMAVPILAGPGSITTAILFGGDIDDWPTRLGLAGVLAGVMIAVFAILLAGRRIQQTLGDLVLTVQTRIWGLLLTAIAAQLILVGLGQTYPAWLVGSMPEQGVSPIYDDVTGDAGR